MGAHPGHAEVRGRRGEGAGPADQPVHFQAQQGGLHGLQVGAQSLPGAAVRARVQHEGEDPAAAVQYPVQERSGYQDVQEEVGDRAAGPA